MVDVPAEGHNCSPHGDDSITLLRCQRRFWKDESFDGQGCRREHADLHLNTPLRGPFLELPRFLVTLGLLVTLTSSILQIRRRIPNKNQTVATLGSVFGVPTKRRDLLLQAFDGWHDPIHQLAEETDPNEILMERAMAHNILASSENYHGQSGYRAA
jgi:hypothetical protein